MSVLVGKGDVELMFFGGRVGQETLEFIESFNRDRWINIGCIPVDSGLAELYQVDCPPCKECTKYSVCWDQAKDIHESEAEIIEAIEQGSFECGAIDSENLLEDIRKLKTNEMVKDFLRGERLVRL